MKKFTCCLVAPLMVISLSCRSSETSSISNYLDIYLISMTSDIRNYVLALELSDGKNEEQLELLRQALEMKYYDLSNIFPNTKNQKVISIICNTERILRNNAIRVSKNCTGELCAEIGRLEEICANVKE